MEGPTRFRLSLILAFSPLLIFQIGCLVSSRKLTQVITSPVVMTANAEQLVTAINDRCNTFHSLTAVVDYQLTQGGPRAGKETTYATFTGYILQRKPGSLRVIVQLPVVHLLALDMATQGDSFKLFIPSHNEVFEGSNRITKLSSNPLENLRPKIFADSLSWGCIGPDDGVTLTSETKTVLDANAKHLIAQPEYDLMVVRLKKNSQQLLPVRVIHFSRINLQPYQEDIYDDEGQIQTEARFGPAQAFDQTNFPGTIVIKRPLEELQIMISVRRLTVNTPLTDDKFELKIPEGTTVHKLD